MTIIKTATPRVMPINEKIEIKFKKLPFLIFFFLQKSINFIAIFLTQLRNFSNSMENLNLKTLSKELFIPTHKIVESELK